MEITINCRDSTLNNSSHTQKKKSLNFLSPLSRCQGYLQVDLYYMQLHYDHYDVLLPRSAAANCGLISSSSHLTDIPFRLHCDSMPRMPGGRVENVS